MFQISTNSVISVITEKLNNVLNTENEQKIITVAKN